MKSSWWYFYQNYQVPSKLLNIFKKTKDFPAVFAAPVHFLLGKKKLLEKNKTFISGMEVSRNYDMAAYFLYGTVWKGCHVTVSETL